MGGFCDVQNVHEEELGILLVGRCCMIPNGMYLSGFELYYLLWLKKTKEKVDEGFKCVPSVFPCPVDVLPPSDNQSKKSNQH